MRPETLWGPGPRRTVAVSLHERSQGGAGTREAMCLDLGAQAHGHMVADLEDVREAQGARGREPCAPAEPPRRPFPKTVLCAH